MKVLLNITSSVGDSKLFVVSYTPSPSNNAKVDIVWTNKEHKPSVPEERQRSESMGGQIWVTPSLMENTNGEKLTSRVRCTMYSGSELALAMSRSIGDPDGTRVGVVSHPDVDILTKPPHAHWFVVAASDGLLDFHPSTKLLSY